MANAARLASLLGFALCLIGAPRGAAAQVVSLAELEASALAKRPELSMVGAKIAAASAQVDKAESAYLPQVAAAVNAGLAPGRELIEGTFGGDKYLISGSRELGQAEAWKPQPRYGLTLGMRGSLYDFGRTETAVAAADAQRKAVAASGDARSELIVREVRGAYLQWLGAYAMLDLAKQGVQLAEARETRVAGLIEEGARPEVDRTTAAQQAAAARIDRARAEEQLELARTQLAYLSAHELAAEAKPDLSLLTAANESASTAPADASPRATAALDKARAAALSRARMQEHVHSPVLAYDVDTGVQGQNEHFFPVYSLGVSLTVPLFDAGSSKAGAAEARAQAAELSAEAESEKARTKYLSERAKLVLRHALERLALAKQAQRWAETEITKLEDSGGLDAATFDALAKAEASRARAQAEVVSAQLSCAQARLGLVSP